MTFLLGLKFCASIVKLSLLLWRWRQQIQPKLWNLFTKLNGVTRKKTQLLAATLYVSHALSNTYTDIWSDRAFFVAVGCCLQFLATAQRGSCNIPQGSCDTHVGRAAPTLTARPLGDFLVTPFLCQTSRSTTVTSTYHSVL